MQTDERSLKYPKLKTRRDQLRERNLCINGPLDDRADAPRPGPVPRVDHGPVVKAGKCQRCLDVWKRSNR